VRSRALIVSLISHQPAVVLSQSKPATSHQPAVFLSQNKSAPPISHQPSEQAESRVGEFRKTCHPRNFEVNEICDVSFQEQRTREDL
jgi:hypothetical protein